MSQAQDPTIEIIAYHSKTAYLQALACVTDIMVSLPGTTRAEVAASVLFFVQITGVLPANWKAVMNLIEARDIAARMVGEAGRPAVTAKRLQQFEEIWGTEK